MEVAPTAARAPTILDVARMAGVSKSTVSNVVRGVTGVTEDKRARVLRAVDALGYRPNVLARQLVQQRTTIFGVMVGDLANPFHAEMTRQIERHAAARGYRVMFSNTQSGEAAELGGLESLLEWRAAGILFLAHAGTTDATRHLVEGRVPTVFVTCSATWGDVVCGDDESGGATATRHLIELGHRRIAYFADPLVEDAADRARQAGYRHAMRQADLPPLVYHWCRGPERLLMRNNRTVPPERVLCGPGRVTAVFSANDLGAIELLDVADRLGICVPNKLSVVGFDDVAIAGLARINLTTMAQPQDELARLAVDRLAARVEGALTGAPLHQTLPVELILRGSTAPPIG
jgi:LacI family transcriptional regulator